jgi:hypothetical protein
MKMKMKTMDGEKENIFLPKLQKKIMMCSKLLE